MIGLILELMQRYNRENHPTRNVLHHLSLSFEQSLIFVDIKCLMLKWHSLLKSATRQDLGKHKLPPSVALSHATEAEQEEICEFAK